MRQVEIVPPKGWHLLACVHHRDLLVGLLFNPLSWTVGFDLWPLGGAISCGPFALAAGLYPDLEASA